LPGSVGRGILQVSAALGGLTLTDLIAARSARAATKDATESSPAETAVILLYLHGGPSQLETYDLKPEAPSSYRSVFAPISTCVPGMKICELFPLQARLADRFSLIRSLHHDVGIHSDGGIIVLTGKRPSQLDPTSQSKSEHPDFGSVASRVRGLGQRGVPPYIAIPSKPYMTRPTYLGAHHSAFELGDPSQPGGKGFAPPRMYLPAGRDVRSFDNRRALLKAVDRYRRDLDQQESLAASDSFREQAFQILTSRDAAEAYDLSQEKDALRDPTAAICGQAACRAPGRSQGG
jgi:hypothetical protein